VVDDKRRGLNALLAVRTSLKGMRLAMVSEYLSELSRDAPRNKNLCNGRGHVHAHRTHLTHGHRDESIKVNGSQRQPPCTRRERRLRVAGTATVVAALTKLRKA
jgi:hypothetical protein